MDLANYLAFFIPEKRCNMIIETASLNDIPELCDLLALLFAQEAEFKPDRNAQEIGLHAIIAHDSVGIVLVARHNGKIIGMVNLLFTQSTALGGKVALLEDMVVLPTERGVGVGSKLLRAAINTAREQSCKRITLLTDNDNATSQTFYKKHGFKCSSMLPFRLSLQA